MLLPISHALQTLLAGYTGIFSYSSIRKVQTYEEMTQKAAKYSNVAEHHLKTTQTTMAAGAVSVLTSSLSSIYLLLSHPSLSSSSSSSSPPPRTTPIILSMILAGGITLAHSHVSNYWRGKAKVPVPGSGDYNDAITTSNVMRSCLAALAGSWALVGCVYAALWVRGWDRIGWVNEGTREGNGR